VTTPFFQDLALQKVTSNLCYHYNTYLSLDGSVDQRYRLGKVRYEFSKVAPLRAEIYLEEECYFPKDKHTRIDGVKIGLIFQDVWDIDQIKCDYHLIGAWEPLEKEKYHPWRQRLGLAH
jgi:hypothetical protein